MQTWDRGTRRIYEAMSAAFRDRIYLDRPVRKVYRRPTGIVVEDENGRTVTMATASAAKSIAFMVGFLLSDI